MKPARLSFADMARLGAAGLRTRPLRVFLSAIGIAIGIAAMLSVVGISTSSRVDLDRTLNRLGTNLLTITPGTDPSGQHTQLPMESTAMVGRIGPVETVSATADLKAISVYRNDHIPIGQTGSVAVIAADLNLLHTVQATVREGSWLNTASAAYPGVVLGAVAAQRLDLPHIGMRTWLGRQWYIVVGILDPVPLIPDLDSSAIVGWASAQSFLDFDGHPTTIYLRATESRVLAVQAVLGRTANPAAPGNVQVSRPSDALAAKKATESAFNGLLVGLGAVALLVGGIGIANTMVISVLERRGEVGLRRALGATRAQIRGQFLSEALMLSTLGGAGGTVLGVTVTGLYAQTRGWPTVVPAWAMLGGAGATLLIGGIAGLYPAIRASRLPPTEALGAP